MVTFITLFLSLVSGTHPVEVAVDGPVARVEILLDRELVGRRTRPPWRVGCNFGPAITPHELVAVAYDAEGSEIHRTRQLINLPRARAETRIVFVSDERGLPTAVKVIWETAEQIQPLGVYVIFDGQVLQPSEEGVFPLPPYDPNQVHIVTAEAQFLDGITAHSDVTFGGRYGSQVATELTAVPIHVDGKKPKLADLEGVFRARGAILTTAALERPGAKVYLVRDHAAVAGMAPIRRRQDALGGRYKRIGGSREPGKVAPKHDQLYFVVPNPTYRKGRELYPTSPAMDIVELGLGWLVTHITNPEASLEGQQLSSAVAVAGVQAAAEGVPRAVLLVLSDEPPKLSGHTPDEVRSYLRSLRVPFYVWSTGAEPAAEWGPTKSIDSSKHFEAAAKAMKKQLARQWIVWVEGNHMINEIELAEGVQGFRLAGSDG
jgi:hypothetical protein